jgi:pimeloyl-ACP methyl ester carboxylesterase
MRSTGHRRRFGWRRPGSLHRTPTGLPAGELAVIPGTSHGLLAEKPDLCNLLITEFLTKDPVQTFAPIRRAGRPG